MKFRLAALVSIALAVTAFGQNSVSTSAGVRGSASFSEPSPFLLRNVVTGAPYSCEQVSGQVQVLADGTRITHSQPTIKMYRDSLGRTRTERSMFRGMPAAANSPAPPVMVEITDPVGQFKYTLDAVNKVAHRQKLASPPPAMMGKVPAQRGSVSGGGGGAAGPVTMLQVAPAIVPNAGAAGGMLSGTVNAGTLTAGPAYPGAEGSRPQITTEKLGSQSIEGVLAEGTRHTTVWPAGSQGNDRPITIVSETWFSPELKLMVMSKTSDPRTGEYSQKLTNISLGEPSAALFLPPPEYAITDEAGRFTMQWGVQ